MKKTVLILTCEHASAKIPAGYTDLFSNHTKILQSHRGSDRGAKLIATYLAKHLNAPVIYGAYSRLLIDLNRSPGNPALFSKWTSRLNKSQQWNLMKTYHQPHWAKVRELVQAHVERRSRVLHLAVHSFTPALKGSVRRTDLGLLYDETRGGELTFCKAWQAQLASAANFKVRRNYPYRGSGDGLTSDLRRHFSAPKYLGIELEFNQKICRSPHRFTSLKKVIGSTLAKILEC